LPVPDKADAPNGSDCSAPGVAIRAAGIASVAGVPVACVGADTGTDAVDFAPLARVIESVAVTGALDAVCAAPV
jgi:hypothetical protein